ncbi:MAG: flagellar hook protein FlgE [Firmicutes bacterium]|nr:flagellar hook protein FlgE [Bacillota bacterium]
MQRSLFTGVTGLRNHQTKLDVIGNNIANVNTVAYKSSRVRFQDVFSQIIHGASAPQGGRGGTNAAQVGMGMTLGAIDVLHTQGSPQYTGVPTDMTIQGSGYFVVTDGVNQFYTRDGAFARGADGDLVNSANGLKLLGWVADAAGNIDTTAELTTLNIPLGERLITKATENLVFSANLNADAQIGEQHVTDALVYDSQGGVHSITFTFEKTGVNEWEWQVIVPPGVTLQQGGSGTLSFDNNGNFASVTDNTLSLGIAGVDDLNLTIDFSAVSQVVGKSNAQVSQQDGFPVGELADYMIGKTGIISGIYTNGMVRNLGQIALATFANAEGLTKAAGNLYTISANSGQARIGAAGEEGRGTIETSSLEMSNVDLSYEFTEMITTSRAYQANSRVITTSDELLQEVVNLKR